MQIENAVALIAQHLGVSVETVREDSHFVTDLGADSLDMVELAMRFEHQMDIAIADDESGSCVTVGDALNLLRQKLAGRAAAA